MFKEPPVLKMVFCSAGYDTPRNLEFEYLGEFEIEIKNILEHESGAHMGLIHEKNQRPKISCYCTFNFPECKLHLIAHLTRGLSLSLYVTEITRSA